MNRAKEKAEEFFKQYEAANIAGDFEAVSRLYQDSFVFGLPQGTKTIMAADLAKIAAKRHKDFKEKGLSGTRLKNVEAGMIDSNYMWVTADYEMDIKGSLKTTSATYIVLDTGHEMKIVMQIDHQNLANELNK
jgi:hypothetical protein